MVHHRRSWSVADGMKIIQQHASITRRIHSSTRIMTVYRLPDADV